MQRHFEHIQKTFPNMVAINLVDHHGKENEIGKLFGQLVEKLDKDMNIR